MRDVFNGFVSFDLLLALFCFSLTKFGTKKLDSKFFE